MGLRKRHVVDPGRRRSSRLTRGHGCGGSRSERGGEGGWRGVGWEGRTRISRLLGSQTGHGDQPILTGPATPLPHPWPHVSPFAAPQLSRPLPAQASCPQMPSKSGLTRQVQQRRRRMRVLTQGLMPWSHPVAGFVTRGHEEGGSADDVMW